jgi:2-oxoisovalerate dehydrogenase E2 component (dihydrolipoyl transacylase)
MERIFVMPDLGEGLEEGRIVEWLVATGDEVALNQPLVEVDTAKATVEIPSPFAGTIAGLHGAQGEDVLVGSPLVTFDVGEAEGRQPTPSAPGARATPAVRKLAKDLGVDLSNVVGTGPEGRITEQDVRGGAAATGAVAYLDADRQGIERSRAAIAANLERQAAIPQVTTFRTVDCTALTAYRADLGVSPLPVVVAALSSVALDHPLITAAWAEGRTIMRGEVHVGIAADTAHGLVVPVVRSAQTLGVGAIAAEIARLADGARNGTLVRDELSGATIAVSNTGSYGSEAGTPILSPGTSVTLAFGVIRPRALVADGQVVARDAATISLTFDHRVLDGATAGRALTDLVALLESPEALGGLPR